MNIQKLIICRHGDYDPEQGGLSGYGKESVGRLGEFISTKIEKIDGILTSSEKRAVESAEVLARRFGVRLMEEKTLNGATEIRFEDMQKLRKTMEGVTGNWIFVSHGMRPSSIARHILLDDDMQQFESQNASALLVNLITKEVEYCSELEISRHLRRKGYL